MILPIKNEYCLCEPFCDYLNLTSPKEHQDAIFEGLKPILDTLGCSEVSPGLFLLPSKLGTFKMHPRGQVMVFGASGGFLDALRASNLYGDYLVTFSDFPHRVSMLHATVDFRVDAPSYLEAIYQRATTGEVYLTRKAINPDHVSRFTGKNQEGVDTGTVYLGNRKNSDVWAKAYDKRQERIAKGLPDPMPMLRIEIAVQSDVGATLKDAYNPKNIFYHFASKSLVVSPGNVEKWEAHGEGFALEKPKQDFTAWQRIWGIMEFSSDIARCLDIAISEWGDDAADELSKLMRKRVQLRLNGSVGSTQ